MKDYLTKGAQNPLVPLIERVAVAEGITETEWPGLILGRFNKPVPRYPLVYTPSICVVAQGQKNVYIGEDCIVYDPLHYLIVALPMPLAPPVMRTRLFSNPRIIKSPFRACRGSHGDRFGRNAHELH